MGVSNLLLQTPDSVDPLVNQTSVSTPITSGTIAPLTMDQAAQNFRQAQDDASVKSDPIYGPTADSIASGKTPMDMQEFYARGGLQNTVQQLQNHAREQQAQKVLKKAYEDFLQTGQRGGQALYDETINKYGKLGIDAKAYIPPPSAGYDENGKFLPYRYSQMVYVGMGKLEEVKKKYDDEQKDQAANKTFAPIMGEPDITQSKASEKALEGGRVTKEMETAIKTIPDPTKLKTNDLKLKQLAIRQGDQDLKRMQILLSQEKSRREFNFKSDDIIADHERAFGKMESYRKSLEQKLSKVQSGETIYDKDGNELGASDLNEMIDDAYASEKAYQRNIDDLRASQKTFMISPATQGVFKDAPGTVHEKPYAPSDTPAPTKTPTPKPTLVPTKDPQSLRSKYGY